MMKLYLLWTVLTGALFALEKQPSNYPFAFVSLIFLSALMFLVCGELIQATALAAIFAALIVGASAVKQHHSGTKLLVSDLALTFSGTLPFMLKQYRKTAVIAVLSGLALAIAAAAVVGHRFGPEIALDVRLAVFVLSAMLCLACYKRAGGAANFRPLQFERCGYFSSFMASLIDISSWWRTCRLRFVDISNDPLDVPIRMPATAVTGKTVRRPDLMMIQHESVFDPRTYGLPVEPGMAGFFSPSAGLSGPLNVEIYGGGSWQTEFSMLTGLSSRSFGPDSYFIFKKGAGRFLHSLPQSLLRLGYRTMLVAGCRRNFMNYDAFYHSVGVERRVFTEDLPAPFNIANYEDTGSDAMFLEAARSLVDRHLQDDPAPLLTIILTNFNHGPHDQRQVPYGSFEKERAFALDSLADDQYGEYYARLAETAASWDLMQTGLEARFPERQTLAIRYGDHQPVMTRRIEKILGLPDDNLRHLKTFYAIEGINMELSAIVPLPGAALDVAFLGTIAQQAGGLPLDPIFAVRAKLFYDCGEEYFNSASEQKKRFHRSLVDLGAVDCEPV